MGKKIISFTLWGDNPKYTIGAIKNAEIAKTLYPDWICRYHISQSVPQHIINEIMVLNNTEIILMGYHGDYTSSIWRFLPIDDPNMNVMISRDADSRLTLREKTAVDEWLNSDKMFHIMRDHPCHGTKILAGMFGIKRGLDLNITKLLDGYSNRLTNNYGTDEAFLREIVYPLVRDNSMVHDEYFNHEEFKKPFPTQRDGSQFVGEIIDHNL